MVFSSALFIFIFLPVTLLGYYLIRGAARNYWLLLMSLIFFGWSQPEYLWIILLNIAVNYTGALCITRVTGSRGNADGGADARGGVDGGLRTGILVLVIAVNLGILFYFKYFDFALSTLGALTGRSFELLEIALPIGISFFTFQGLSYVIDVYRGEVRVQKNIAKTALYITLFPQLVAGPIVRYKDIESEIDRRTISADDFAAGIERFIIGLSKKVIIANTLALMVDSVWDAGAGGHSVAVSWAVSIAYSLQIYFDFSGYSDMAIGLGRMFGFHFNENFNLPYISANISEFWRRWHISLSSWFRDYVYIPLGGNRKRVYLNLAVVFLLTGIWHGAAWHFIFWGIWHGCFILIERFLRNVAKAKQSDGKKAKPEAMQSAGRLSCSAKAVVMGVFSHIYTLFVVNIGWVLFRADNLREALEFIKCMFGQTADTVMDNKLFWYMDRWTGFVFVLGLLFSSPLPGIAAKKIKEASGARLYPVLKYAGLILLFVFSIIRVVSGTYNPFIYFQF